MRLLLALSALVLVLVTTSTAQATTLQISHKPFNRMSPREKKHYLKKQIFHDRSIIRFAKNHNQINTHELRNAVTWAYKSLRIAGKNLRRLLAVPVVRPVVTASSGVIAALLCIHHWEGSWTDPGGPYWGGLQMDLSFQQAYGPEFFKRWGTADHWPVWAQLVAGARAVAVRGFNPWPNSRLRCGV